MRLAHAVRIGSWFLVGLNLLMAVGTIAVFSRMAPAIMVIIERNERSLQACEDMLTLLAHTGSGMPLNKDQQNTFNEVFIRARDNTTEQREPEALGELQKTLPQLFAGSRSARKQAIEAITFLAQINRDAMAEADHRAQKVGRTGAWAVAFMAMTVFLAGVVFISSLTKRVVKPLEEIHTVITAHRNGDMRRRCTGTHLVQDVHAVFLGINELLDQQHTPSTSLEDMHLEENKQLRL